MFDYFVGLALIWVGFLEVRFKVVVVVVVRGVKLSRLKLVRIMLEIWNLARKYIHICKFRKYMFPYQGPLILLIPAIFCKKSAFLAKNSTFTPSSSMRAVRFFSSIFSFYKVSFRLCVRNLAFELLQIGHKSEKWQWDTHTRTRAQQTHRLGLTGYKQQNIELKLTNLKL